MHGMFEKSEIAEFLNQNLLNSQLSCMEIMNNIRSRTLFLGLSLPEQFQSQWDLPPCSPPVRQPQISHPLVGFLISIVRLQNNLIGIYWRDKDIPIDGFIKYDVNYYHAVNEAIQVIPEEVHAYP